MLAACIFLLLMHAWASQAADTPTAPESVPQNWLSVDSSSAQANSADQVHALMTSVIQQRQLSPLRAARLFATVRVAQSEAIRQITVLPVEAVASLAASQTLSWMLPLEDSARWASPALLAANRFGGLTPDAALLIDSAIKPVLSYALDDGADARRRPLIKPEPKPGVWLRTPPLFAEQPAEPQGGTWKPWCQGTDRIQATPTAQHGSAMWQEELRQIVTVAINLSPEQKDIARRWHLDAGSITPPGVWNAIVTAYLSQHPPPVARRQRLLAVLNMAMQDALVAAWRIKLQYWSERPITAVRRELDPDFEPLLVTPPFPGYVSGHATVSAAAAGVLSHFLPEQRSRWHALAQEAAVSRLYGGIHFASDNHQGLALGAQVAQTCLAEFEGPGTSVAPALLTSSAGMSPDFFVLPRMRAPPE